jgi:hypothetical protein
VGEGTCPHGLLDEPVWPAVREWAFDINERDEFFFFFFQSHFKYSLKHFES